MRMYIERNNEKIVLTPEELKMAYYEQLHQYRLEDAERQLLFYIGYDEDDDTGAVEEEFAKKYGFSIRDAVNATSEHYILEAIVDRYEDCLDCNIDENSTWQSACSFVLKSLNS